MRKTIEGRADRWVRTLFVSCPEWGLATAPVQRRAFNDVDWQGVIVEGLMERFDVRLMWYGDEGGLVTVWDTEVRAASKGASACLWHLSSLGCCIGLSGDWGVFRE